MFDINEFKNNEKIETIRFNINKYITIEKNNNTKRLASTKTKSEVSGSGKKPWKQKGTGHARVGSIRSPLWKGGGVTFGPKPRITKKNFNNKEKLLLNKYILINKLKSTFHIKNLDDLIANYKRKTILKILNYLKIDLTKRIVILVENPNIDKIDKYLFKNFRNIKYMLFNNLDIRSLLISDYILMDSNRYNLLKTEYEVFYNTKK